MTNDSPTLSGDQFAKLASVAGQRVAGNRTPDYFNPAMARRPWNLLAVASIVSSPLSVPVSLVIIALVQHCGIIEGVDDVVAFFIYCVIFFAAPAASAALSMIAMASEGFRGSWMAMIGLLISIASPVAFIAYCLWTILHGLRC